MGARATDNAVLWAMADTYEVATPHQAPPHFTSIALPGTTARSAMPLAPSLRAIATMGVLTPRAEQPDECFHVAESVVV